MPLTRALWLANALFWLLLAGLVAFQIQQIFFAGETPALRLEPVTVEALPPLALAGAATRNPFDAAGTAWLAAGSTGPEATPGQVRGIVVLPGIGLAMTDRGPVKPGASLDAGRLLSVKAAGAVVATPTGPQALALPGSNRPTLQDLNQAKPMATNSNSRQKRE
jgi:hypothetical protein